MTLFYLYRIASSLHFRSATHQNHGDIEDTWAYKFIINTFISGLMWSYLAMSFPFEGNFTHIIMLIIVYTGITASAHTTHSPIFISFPAFYLPPIIMLMYQVISQLDDYGDYLFFMFLLYIITMFVSALNSSKKMIELFQSQINNQELQDKLIESNKELSKLANRDGLTDLYNRRYFDQKLTEEWAFHSLSNEPLSLIVIDIDYFKQFNDTYGHDLGDKCLIALASLLKKSIKNENEICARYGGEEFVVLLPMTTSEETLTVANSIKSFLDELEIPHANSSIAQYVTISMGTSTIYPAREQVNQNQLFIHADVALYQAKASGRDQIVVYNEAITN